MITILTGAVRPKTIYYVIVYYQQPQSLSTRVEQILIADQVKSNISVTFQYCPARSGCRIVLGEEDGRRFQFSKGVFTATIEHDRRTQVVGRKNVPFDYTGLACNILTGTRANLVDNLPELDLPSRASLSLIVCDRVYHRNYLIRLFAIACFSLWFISLASFLKLGYNWRLALVPVYREKSWPFRSEESLAYIFF